MTLWLCLSFVANWQASVVEKASVMLPYKLAFDLYILTVRLSWRCSYTHTPARPLMTGAPGHLQETQHQLVVIVQTSSLQ